MSLPHIIVADDDPIFRQIMKSYFGRAGFEVIEFASGRGVLECLRRQEIHAAVLDIMMPELDGMELLTAIGKLHQKPKVIAVSSDAFYLDLAKELGADAVLQKPVSPEGLHQVMTAIRPS